MQKVCPYCEGRAVFCQKDTMAKKWNEKYPGYLGQEEVKQFLLKFTVCSCCGHRNRRNRIAQLEQRYGKYIFIKGKDDLHPEEIRIRAVGSKTKLEKFAMPVKDGQIIGVTIEETHISNPNDGIARVDGYVIVVEDGASLLGTKTKVKINKANRTYAKAKLT